MTAARRLTDVGPVALVPAAWAVAIGAIYTPVVTERTLLIALIVMDVTLVAFYLVSREAMTGPVLGAWQRVLLWGLGANLVGTAAMLLAPDATLLVGLPLYAWMVLPGAGYVRTWAAVGAALPRAVYLLAAVLSFAGALLYAVAPVSPLGARTTGLVALLAVGGGQTVGIATAAIGSRRRPGDAGPG